jgi:hypothetical protein
MAPRGFAMAIGRAVLHRELGHGSLSGEWARRLWRWRHWALLLLALLAGAMATVSLVRNPHSPDEPPPTTSYLPAPHFASP